MDPFWSSFCEYLGRCGRSGLVFVVTLVVLSVLLIMGSVGGVFDYIKGNPSSAGIAIAIILMVVLRLAWRRRDDRRRTPCAGEPLAYEEWRKARAKLLPKQNAKRI